jgi:carbamoyl-phosphate synthase large subunit
MKRMLEAKLSVAYRARGGIISSGYSQGRIEAYESICRQAEAIASVLQSKGPLNVQGRVRQGILVPFEINPRFSASTYLRALAGFNEVDIYVKTLLGFPRPERPEIRPGLYLRSLTETQVPLEQVR